MATTILLGFTNPEKFQEDAANAVAPEMTNRSDPMVNQTESLPLPSPVPVSIPAGAIRPSSLARVEPFGFILGGISSRAWLHHSVYSPDRIIMEQRASVPGKFHGVGFPDIRTRQKHKRSPFAAPGPWAQLIAWRTLQGAGKPDGVEPIARVRCMGLTPQAVATRADRYRDLIYTYADQYEVSPHLVKAVITEESCFNNKALSPVGAQGLMQLMPDTARWLKVRDVHDPAQNVSAGVRYLASLQKQFDTIELALAAYNAGPGNVKRYNGVPPFAETEAYVVKVQAHYRRYMAAHNMLNPVKEEIDQASYSGLVP
ncbi:MAG: lytic transglycosylase domain-containing protein [Granulosicoccus sp.]